MWTATIESKNFVKGTLSIGIIFTNGSDSFTHVYELNSPNFESFKYQVKNRLDNLNGLETLKNSIQTGNIPDIIVTNPTPIEIEKQDFLNDYNKWQKVKRAIDMGVLTGQEPQVVALQNKVKTAFKATYLDIL